MIKQALALSLCTLIFSVGAFAQATQDGQAGDADRRQASTTERQRLRQLRVVLPFGLVRFRGSGLGGSQYRRCHANHPASVFAYCRENGGQFASLHGFGMLRVRQKILAISSS